MRELQITRQTLHFWRLLVKAAADAFVVIAVRGLGQHSPDQAVEGDRHGAYLAGDDTLLSQGHLEALLGRHAPGQAETQVGRAEHQGQGQYLRSLARQPFDGRVNHRCQQRHGIDRVDDEHCGPALRSCLQGPEQLRAVDREGVEQRVGDQHQPERQE
ncbi:hypothetical protein D3C77_540240 [compost metagenome]